MLAIAKVVISDDELHEKNTPSVDRAKAEHEDKASEASGDVAPRFAIPNKVDVNHKNGDGTWEVTSDGTHIWRHRFSSSGCNSLNFGFCEYDIQGWKAFHL